jgi:hypothetical protein
MLYLVKFNFGLSDAFGESLEVLTEEDMTVLKKFVEDGDDIYLGEINGKHSEVSGPIEEHDYEIVTTDQEVIENFKKIVHPNSSFGAFHMIGTIYEQLEEDDEN